MGRGKSKWVGFPCEECEEIFGVPGGAKHYAKGLCSRCWSKKKKKEYRSKEKSGEVSSPPQKTTREDMLEFGRKYHITNIEVLLDKL